MQVKPGFFVVFLLLSCIYDPPLKGKEISIHNQTNRPLLIVDSLTGGYFKLYDTAIVNNRRYITRLSNFVTEYGVFHSDQEMEALKHKKKNSITLYIIGQENLKYAPDSIFTNRLFRSFELIIDTLKKHELNQLFITEDTIFLGHDFEYYSDRRR